MTPTGAKVAAATTQAGTGPLLEVSDLEVEYGGVKALFGVDLRVEPDTVLGVVGPNGAGKSTLLKTIMGVVRPTRGSVVFDGETITGQSTASIARRGICLVPEGRELYSGLTVGENLALGAMAARRRASRFGSEASLRAWLFEVFPILGQRTNQLAGTLSGGEQQMLAIARALLSQPRLLLLDEPSLGLSPTMVERIVQALSRIVEDFALTVVLVEQNIGAATALADKIMVMRGGRIAAELTPDTVTGFNVEELQRMYWQTHQ